MRDTNCGMTQLTKETARLVQSKRDYSKTMSRAWYLRELEAIARGKPCTAQQMSALKDLAKVRGWNKRREVRNKPGQNVPVVSPELAERLMG